MKKLRRAAIPFVGSSIGLFLLVFFATASPSWASGGGCKNSTVTCSYYNGGKQSKNNCGITNGNCGCGGETQQSCDVKPD